MNRYRFVHVSDIHFGQEKQNGTVVARDDVRAELLNDCRARENTVGRADGILVTGDIAFSGKKAEYVVAGKWLDELTKAAGCKRTSVFMVPGNHDVDLAETGRTARMLHAQLRDGTPNIIQADLESLAKEYQNTPHPLFRKLDAYSNFALEYGCDFESVAKPVCQRDYPLGGQVILRFLGLNSVQISEGKQDAKGKMVLGNAQYSFQRVHNAVHVVMVHHPLDWFRDHRLAENSIHSRARVSIFGHEHLSKITKVCDQDGGWERIVIDSGAATPPEDEEVYGFTYNWLEFALDEKERVQHLVLTVYPRVWSEARTEFIADHSRMTLTSNESATFSLSLSRSLRHPRTGTNYCRSEYNSRCDIASETRGHRKQGYCGGRPGSSFCAVAIALLALSRLASAAECACPT